MGWAGPLADASVRARVGWWLFAAALAVVLLVLLAEFLGWAVFGLFLYYVARPVTRRLRRRGVSPTISAAITLGLLTVPLVVLLLGITLYTVAQLGSVALADVEGIVAALFPALDLEDVPTSIDQLSAFTAELRMDPTVETGLSWIGDLVGTFARQTYNAFLTVLFVFFLLRDERRIGEWFHEMIFRGHPSLVEYLRAVDRGLHSVYFGYTLTLLAITVLASVVYHALNLVAPPGLAIPQPMLLAVVTGLISVVPLVGRNLVYGIVVAYLVITAIRIDPALLWFPGLFVVVMNLAFDNVIRIYVRPSLSGRLFHIGLVMFAYLLGPSVFGWYGIFLGPLVMVVVVQFLRYRLPVLVHHDT